MDVEPAQTLAVNKHQFPSLFSINPTRDMYRLSFVILTDLVLNHNGQSS